MEDFIKNAVNQLGLDEAATRNATGAVLGFLKEGLGDKFSVVADELPGADSLISGAQQAAPAEEGGLLGSLTSAASSLLGDSAGEGLELIGSLKNFGLSTEQGSSLVTMVINFLKEHVGDSVVELIVEKIPALKPFLS